MATRAGSMLRAAAIDAAIALTPGEPPSVWTVTPLTAIVATKYGAVGAKGAGGDETATAA